MYLEYQIVCLLVIVMGILDTVHDHIWAQTFKRCSGKWQSPIAISSTKAVPLPLPAVEMIGYHNFLSGPITMKNTGKSLSITVNKELSKKRLPYLFGAMLNESREYEFESLHFHWGSKNNRGSEHILNGVRFPMEMHMIHRNKAYVDISHALEHEDGLVVLGFFFQLQEEDNKKLHSILSRFPDVQWNNTEVQINTSIALASLIPHNIDIFYMYKGSLTTPPCNEAVAWIIFPTPIPISFKQMNKFRILSNGEGWLVDNYRHLQDTGNRKVYVRRMDSSSASTPDMVDLDILGLRWFWQ
ncbi:carbonic anhydrase 2 isoform X2 [Orussus abietinus]|uniref:carbonic anhydrase 2 isoform X2 n=2 Tax=Orussus abietinus TaxID=222816 RepID=UPI00062623E8|nr:carbonic anhydrase 2 isoform X2 [Orussus abietinus]